MMDEDWPDADRRQRRLAILLGPYRNLTTLTAAILSLHPEIQVLNHGAQTLWAADCHFDFIAAPNPQTFARFMKAAWRLSASGQRGDQGGSILHSHAFDGEQIRALYHDIFGDQAVKPDALWLVWKELMRVQRRLMAAPGSFSNLCRSFPDIRFILPIRNPLDCALSNLSTGHYRHFGFDREATLTEVLNAVLQALKWVLEQREEHPTRVFAYTQYDPQPARFSAMASFLEIEPTETWLSAAKKAFVIQRRYECPASTVAAVRKLVVSYLGRWSDIAEPLVDQGLSI